MPIKIAIIIDINIYNTVPLKIDIMSVKETGSAIAERLHDAPCHLQFCHKLEG